MSRQHRLVLLLAAVTAIGPFAMQALAPALPAIAKTFSVSPAASQLMLSLSLVAMAVATLIWGPVSDRLGRRPTLIAGMVLVVMGSVAAMLAPTLGLAVAGRTLQAAGAAAGMVLARAVAQDIYGRTGAAGVLGQITAAMVVAPMIAPALSGLIVEQVGWRVIFAIVAAMGLGLSIWSGLGLRETAPPSSIRTFAGVLAGFREIGSMRSFWSYAAYGTFSFSSFLFFVGAAPYVMDETYGQGPSVYGLYFMAIAGAYMVANFFCGALTRRFGGDQILRAGGALGIIGLIIGVVLVSAGLVHPLVLFGPAALHSIGAGLSVPNAMAGAVGASPERAGAASGLMGFAQFIVGGVAAQVSGSLPHGSALPVLSGMAMLLALALGLHLALGAGRPLRTGV